MFDIGIIQKALAAAQKNQSYAFATIVETTIKGTPRKAGSKMIVMNDGSIYGSVGGGIDELKAKKACLKAIRTRKPELITCEDFGRPGEPVCGGYSKIFIEPFIGTRRLIICGAGHIALPLSIIGKMLGFSVSIIDPRPEFANKERFPHADKILAGPYGKNLAALKGNIDDNCYLVIMTYGHVFDYECLDAVMGSDTAYIGLIASHNKKQKFFKQLKQAGYKEKQIKKITSPTGIDIGAQTPEEIAISIAAEIIAECNKEFYGTDKFLEKKSIKPVCK